MFTWSITLLAATGAWCLVSDKFAADERAVGEVSQNESIRRILSSVLSRWEQPLCLGFCRVEL